ncbi:serine/threonine protein kinase [Chitinophagaceae bacterium IBVUCB2]|nr:serine/threonine protein kinase [Chitinophagaceae bacterium IBVUCB2]
MTAKNKLGLFDFTMIVVSLVIGMGIFRTPANVAAASPTPAIFFIAWFAGGLVALCGALTYAEIGSRLPVMGGYYKVFSYAYHPSIAFGINCIILVSNAASGAAVALVGSEYITSVIIPNARDADYIQTVHISIALAAIVIFYGINMLGLRLSAKTQTVLTVIKIGLVLLLITPLFFASGNAATSSSLITSTIDPGFMEYIKAFGIGLVAVSFTYGGYQQTINFGSEVDKPNKNIPRGIFMGIFIIISLYLTINYAYVHVIGFEELKTSKNIAAIMASKIFGVDAERILSMLLFLSVLAYINVLLLSNPRVMVAMSEDKILPAAFQKRNSRGALTLALTVFAGLAAIIVFWAKEFDTLLSFTIFLDCFGMVLSAGSIFIIRKRTKHLNGTGIFSMKLYPLLPIIFIAAYSFVAISLLINETKLSLIGLGVLAGFIGLYFVVKAIKPAEQTNS